MNDELTRYRKLYIKYVKENFLKMTSALNVKRLTSKWLKEVSVSKVSQHTVELKYPDPIINNYCKHHFSA